MEYLIISAAQAEAVRLLLAKHSHDDYADQGLDAATSDTLFDLFLDLDDAKEAREAELDETDALLELETA